MHFAVGVDRGIGLRDYVKVFFVCGQVVDLISDTALDHLAIRSLDETEGIDAAISC